MERIQTRIRKSLQYIRSIDKEYIKHKYHQLRNLKKEDVVHFVKTHRKLVMYAAGIGFAVMLIIPIATYIYFGQDLSSKERILNRKNAGVVLLDRNEKPFFTLFDATTRNPISYEDLPEHTTQAFVAVEDKDFYEHPGFSITGFARAIRENLLSESFSQGGSTISQQLIKNAILSPDKKLLRKYQELVLAVELERKYEKEDILEMYLNTIYFGEGAFGIQDASQRFFSKDASELTLGESALLAGVIRAPSALSPISGNLESALRRKDLILGLMEEQGYITEAEKIAAQKQKIEINPTMADINEEAVHFALMIQDALIEEYDEQTIANSGFTVKTTLDLNLQKVAQTAVANQVANLAASDVSNGAAVVMDPKTGEVLALVGSHDWSDEENGRINMAVRPRQPGSSFKPIIYAKAIEDRVITASTQLKDEPVKFGTYEPKNYDNNFRGNVLARNALALSLNIPAVHVMDMLGVNKGVEFAQELGISSLDDDLDYGLPLVLGAAEVPLIEMTNAYAAFANDGDLPKRIIFTEVRDKNGEVILEQEPDSEEVLPPVVAYIINSILSDNKARAGTFGSSLTLSRPAAVKTGTTNDYKDALTIGYTPQVVVGVWIGNNDATPMTSIAGSLGAAPIWRQIMESYLTGKEVVQFRKPIGIAELKVCFEDGGKVDFATESAYLEYFVRGTAPTKLCGIPTPTPTQGEQPTNTPGPTNTNAPQPTSVPPTTAPTTVPTSAPTSPPITVTATPSVGSLPTLFP